MKPCDICIDEKCGGTHNCDCTTCNSKDACPKYLKPTIRITTKCTQSCSHCCFDCSPKRSEMMSITKAKEVKQFLSSNNIHAINLMGGEFFCNPDWFEIIDLLSEGLVSVRLVTNGDWANNPTLREKLKDLLTANKQINLSISKDRWHTNEFIDLAENFCLENAVKYNVATEEQTTKESIVPIGRGELAGLSPYSMFSCYCHNPAHQYSFLIDEQGEIYKCSFGSWDYANVDEYLEGEFAERFKHFNTVFYSTFIPNCTSCQRTYKRASARRKNA